jgi:hypothetical protein
VFVWLSSFDVPVLNSDLEFHGKSMLELMYICFVASVILKTILLTQFLSYFVLFVAVFSTGLLLCLMHELALSGYEALIHFVVFAWYLSSLLSKHAELVTCLLWLLHAPPACLLLHMLLNAISI